MLRGGPRDGYVSHFLDASFYPTQVIVPGEMKSVTVEETLNIESYSEIPRNPMEIYQHTTGGCYDYVGER
jgi:hypothetical protein